MIVNGIRLPTAFVEAVRQGKTVQLHYYKVPERALDQGSYLIGLAVESYRSACAVPIKRKTRTAKYRPGDFRGDRLPISRASAGHALI